MGEDWDLDSVVEQLREQMAERRLLMTGSAEVSTEIPWWEQ